MTAYTSYKSPVVVKDGPLNTATIRLSYYENHYPDNGDFTLVYGLSKLKQQFAQTAPAELWSQLQDVLDDTICNAPLKARWIHSNRYGCCAGQPTPTNMNYCCGGCFCTANCCRFCCCNGACHSCACRSCVSDREMYIGGVFMIVYGLLNIGYFAIFYPWYPVMLIIIGSIMVGNYNQGERLKYQWREALINLLVQNLANVSNQFNVSFAIERYPIYNLVLRMTFLSAAPLAVQTTGQVMYVQQQPVQSVQYAQGQVQSTQGAYSGQQVVNAVQPGESVPHQQLLETNH